VRTTDREIGFSAICGREDANLARETMDSFALIRVEYLNPNVIALHGEYEVPFVVTQVDIAEGQPTLL
jgi:hypothetical protein